MKARTALGGAGYLLMGETGCRIGMCAADALWPTQNIDVTTIGSTGPEIISMGYAPPRLVRLPTPSDAPPSKPREYQPAVQRMDWLADMRAAKRQAMVGTAILGAIVLAAVAAIGGLL